MSFPKISKNLIPRVKRAAFIQLKNLALHNNGIIFGGFVRDEIIAEYYNGQFDKTESLNRSIGSEYKPEKFWDPTYMPETKARILNPDDMDVSFANSDDAENFIGDVRRHSDYKNVRVIDATIDRNNHYYSPMISSVRELRIDIIIGYVPFIYDGITVSIKADIIIPRNRHIEPPFRNLDMLCNGFVIKKNERKRFSCHTGTIIDTYSDYERLVVVAQIMRDMKDFKTALCFTKNTYQYRLSHNLIAFKRIKKMCNKKFKWEFINMPFKTKPFSEYISNSDENTQECAICTTEFKSDDKISYTTTQKEDKILCCPPLHYKCFMKHMNYQQQNASRHRDTKFYFNCPFRSQIDFSKCSLDIGSLYICDMP
jgi:hypothetical protein